MEQIIVEPDGSLKVVETGPRGLRGPIGPRGNPGPSTPGRNSRAGIEFLTPVVTTYGEGEAAVTYDLYEMGGTTSERYGIIGPGSSGRPMLIRIVAEVDLSKAQPFYIMIVSADPGTKIFFDTTVNGLGIAEAPLWAGTDNNGSITLMCFCVPASFIGGGGDVGVWLPSIVNTMVSRVGHAKVALVAAAGNGTTTPDATANLHTTHANVSSANLDAGAYTFPSIRLLNVMGSRPLRLEIMNATSVTKFQVVETFSGYTQTFDPDALGLRVGTSILGTVHMLANSPTDTTDVSIVVDPIGGGA